MNILVVGGGWSGLAAGVELARHGVPVTVLEAARQLGGRARAVRFGEHRVDNGQHMLLGAYRGVLDLLRTLQVPEQRVLRRRPLDLKFLDDDGPPIQVRTPRLPAPLHLLYGLLTARGLSPGRRLAAIRMASGLRRARFHVDPDTTVADYLRKARQDAFIARALWHPLCLAALNTPPEQASMNVYMRVLREAFFASRRSSDVLLPIADLSRCLPEPARDFIERHAGGVRLASRVVEIGIDGGRVRGVRLAQTSLPADHVILATPPDAAHVLLRPHAGLQREVGQLSQLHALPICTLYLRFPRGTTLERDFAGLLGATGHWIFDRGRLTGENGMMAVVISGPGQHLREDATSLTQRILDDLRRHFPHWPPPLDSKLVRERRAGFAATVGVDHRRPAHATAVAGLWLAGDYTATGFPATLEGAVRSGVECARMILGRNPIHA